MGAAKFRSYYERQPVERQPAAVQEDGEQILLDKMGKAFDIYFWYLLGPAATIYILSLVIKAAGKWIF